MRGHGGIAPQGPSGQRLDFSQAPLLVFWETTRACLLACRHCRAEAIPHPLPGQLSHDEGLRLIEAVRSFGDRPPILVFTGGDLLMRDRVHELLRYAHDLGLVVAASPSVTSLLTREALNRLRDAGASSLSISLDGLRETHDYIRGAPGCWDRTLEAIRAALATGLHVQVNTCVMQQNYRELPEVFSIIRRMGVPVWEVFYLVKTGRATSMEELDPDTCEQVTHFLYDASMYGVRVRTVEAPFFRRVAIQRSGGMPPPRGPVYEELTARLTRLCGGPTTEPQVQLTPTRDGNGIVFVAHDGTITPGGFLPLGRGNVRVDSLVDVYRNDELFRALRRPEGFRGRCGACEFREICGGSRARAYAASGDPLGEDPACPYTPPSWTR